MPSGQCATVGETVAVTSTWLGKKYLRKRQGTSAVSPREDKTSMAAKREFLSSLEKRFPLKTICAVLNDCDPVRPGGRKTPWMDVCYKRHDSGRHNKKKKRATTSDNQINPAALEVGAPIYIRCQFSRVVHTNLGLIEVLILGQRDAREPTPSTPPGTRRPRWCRWCCSAHS